MSLPSNNTKARPSPWWYTLVAVLWIASAVVFSVVLVKPIVDVLSTDVVGFSNGDPVSIGTDGVTVYVQDDDNVGLCTLTGEDGSTSTMQALDLSADFEVDTTGPTLSPYASTPDNLPAGTYQISCEGADSTILATGERIDEDALEKNIAFGFIASLILGVLGLALLIVLLVMRSRSKSRIREAQSAAYYGSWAQQGYAPEGTYPPQAYDPYQQQQQQQQGYGSPQGYAPPPADPYGQQQPPASPYGQQPPAADPYGQPPQPPPPTYDPYAQQPPPAADPYAQQPPSAPYGEPAAEQPAANSPGEEPESAPAAESTPESSPPRDSTDSGSSSDSGSSDSGSNGSSDSGSSGSSGSSDSNNN